MDSTPTIVNQLEIVALESRCFIVVVVVVGFALSENEGSFLRCRVRNMQMGILSKSSIFREV